MSSGGKVVRKDSPLWKKIKRGSMGDLHVVVGIPAGIPAEGDSKGATLAEVAAWNHYGTEDISARPFLSGPLDGRQSEVKEIMARIGAGVLSGKVDLRTAMSLLGEWARNRVLRAIAAGFPPENAKSTIARKGSSKPLVDTGQLKGSIVYEIRKDGGNGD